MNSFLKAGLQGGTGTGKSTTAALILLGISKTYCDGAPVFVFDTEPGWQFLQSIFAVEGVSLIIENGRHFKGMHDSLKRAIREGCCGYSVDSITHPWQELLERFADSTGRVPFHKFNQIKPLWNEWTTDFLNAPMHCIANGRLAWEYSYEQAEDGKKELVKGDAKMKAGGGESFGYEPHVLCEMSHERVRMKDGSLGGLQYNALILKDRSRVLNGQEFHFTDIGRYKKGGYAKVFEAFRPHVEELRAIAGVTVPKSTSAALVPNGDSEFYKRQRAKLSLLEEWDATMELMFPGSTAANKKARAVVGEAFTGLRSRTKFEEFTADQLQQCVALVRALECRIKKENGWSEDNLAALIEMAREDFRGQPTSETSLEHQLKASLAATEITEEDALAVMRTGNVIAERKQQTDKQMAEAGGPF